LRRIAQIGLGFGPTVISLASSSDDRMRTLRGPSPGQGKQSHRRKHGLRQLGLTPWTRATSVRTRKSRTGSWR